MLTSLILTLSSQKMGVLPPHLGRANHSKTLVHIAKIQPELAKRLHDEQSLKPLTCSGLLLSGHSLDNVTITKGQTVELHITGLTPDVSNALFATFLDHHPTHWNLHEHPFELIEATANTQQHPWAGVTTFADLAARPTLLAKQLPPRVTLNFASPTSFKSSGRHVPLPLPSLVFGSLASRWNEFSSFVTCPDLRQFASESIFIQHYQTRSEVVRTKATGVVVGFVGKVTYAVEPATPANVALLHQLADFAAYSGVGVKTSFGLGQCRKV